MMIRPSAGLVACALVVVVLAGCIGDDAADPNDGARTTDPTTKDWTRALPGDIAGFEHVADATEMSGGAGLWIDGDHAYVSSPGTGFYIVNVTDPGAPRIEGFLEESSRDVGFIHYPNGTKVAVLASGAVDFVDVTDPAEPILLGSHSTEGAVHNVGVLPGTPYVYNSRSIDLPGVDILDATDPSDPKLVGVFGDLTCHDVTFLPEKDRAYCAGIRETQIWDVSDPEAPTVVSRIHNPAIQIHHAVYPLHNGTLLAIGDEFAGSTPAAYGCFAATDTPLGNTVSDPVGAVWFYDTSDETLPKPLGYISVPFPADNLPAAPCTAHFGGVLHDDNGTRDLLVMGWRYSGTHLIDFADPTMPRLVDTYRGTGDTWDSQFYNGYVFTGNGAVGLEVLSFVGV